MTASRTTTHGCGSTRTLNLLVATTVGAFLLAVVMFAGIVHWQVRAEHLQKEVDRYERELSAVFCSRWPTPYHVKPGQAQCSPAIKSPRKDI